MAAFTSAHPGATSQALRLLSSPRAHRGTLEARPFCILVHVRNARTVLPSKGKLSAIQDSVKRNGSRLFHGRTGAEKSSRKHIPLACSIHDDPVTVEGTENTPTSSGSTAQRLSLTNESSSGNGSLDQEKLSGEEKLRLQMGSSAVPKLGVSGAEVHINRPKRIDFDYGFQANFLRTGPTVPRNVVKLAFENFGREFQALRRSYLFNELAQINPADVRDDAFQVLGAYIGRAAVLLFRGVDNLLQLYDGLPVLNPEIQDLNSEQEQLRSALKKLTLSNDAVWEREKKRPPVEAPWWILVPYYVLCTMLDVIFNDRPIQRFWFLETVARMPYFSYISMLHLYETLGWWRVGAEVRKVHFAEEWNEMHHLKIMEALGGDLQWGDRFFAQHAAFFYYWVLNAMFLISPKVAYNFSELIESHAVDTYGQFADENEQLLKTLPPPPVAIQYYEAEDLYMYDEFQTSQVPESRRPKVDSLYDVFVAICGDEGEHVKTMVACQRLDSVVTSPHRPKRNKVEV